MPNELQKQAHELNNQLEGAVCEVCNAPAQIVYRDPEITGSVKAVDPDDGIEKEFATFQPKEGSTKYRCKTHRIESKKDAE